MVLYVDYMCTVTGAANSDLWYLRLKEVTATLHHSGEEPNYPMEEVVVTMTPML